MEERVSNMVSAPKQKTDLGGLIEALPTNHYIITYTLSPRSYQYTTFSSNLKSPHRKNEEKF